MTLFIDDKFDKSYKYLKNIIWKRPFEITNQPVFIDDDICIEDIAQGLIGNCWLIATFNILINSFDNFIQFLNPFQTFCKPKYNGKFIFNFVINDEIKLVTIDDFLPTIGNKLVFCHNKKNSNEFWSSLLEKAVAKLLFNSYEGLENGESLNYGPSLFNFNKTTYIQSINISKVNFDFENFVYLLGSNSKVYDDQLVSSHAYALIDYKEKHGKRYLKIKNPYNNSSEYSKQLFITNDFQNKSDGLFWTEADTNFKKNFPYILEINKKQHDIKINNYTKIRGKKWTNDIFFDKTTVYVGILIKKNEQNRLNCVKYSCTALNNLLFKYEFKLNTERKQHFLFIQLNCENLFIRPGHICLTIEHFLEYDTPICSDDIYSIVDCN
jgi:hypothetical protein